MLPTRIPRAWPRPVRKLEVITPDGRVFHYPRPSLTEASLDASPAARRHGYDLRGSSGADLRRWTSGTGARRFGLRCLRPAAADWLLLKATTAAKEQPCKKAGLQTSGLANQVSGPGVWGNQPFTVPAPANSVFVSCPPRNTRSPAASGSSDSTSNPIDVLPVASLIHPIRNGPPKPARLPIELISAIPPAAGGCHRLQRRMPALG